MLFAFSIDATHASSHTFDFSSNEPLACTVLTYGDISGGIDLSGGGCYEINADITTPPNNTINGDIKLFGSGTTLTINGDITRMNASFEINTGSTLIVNGDIFQLDSDLIVKGGDLQLNGSITADGKLELSDGGDATFNNGNFTSTSSDIIIKSPSTLALTNGSTLQAPGGQTLSLENGATITSDGSGNLIAAGTKDLNGTAGTNYPLYLEYCSTYVCEEVAGFIVIESGGSTETSENGNSDTFQVFLILEPSGNVELDMVSSDMGEFTVSPASLTFNTGNFNSPQTVTVTGVDDGANDNDYSGNVTINIDQANTSTDYDAVASQNVPVTNFDNDFLNPTAQGFTKTTNEDTEVFIAYADLNYMDADGQAMDRLEVVSIPANGTLFRDTSPFGTFDGTDVILANTNTLTFNQINSGRLGFIPDANEFGVTYTTFMYRVYDEQKNYPGGTATSAASIDYTVTIDVNSVNDPPVFSTSGNVTVLEDFAAQQTVTVTPGPVPPDEAGQTVTYSLSPASVTFATIGFDTNSGEVTIDAIADENGTQVFTITADDGQGANNLATQNFTLTVTAVNDPPSFTPGANIQVNEDAVAQNFAAWATAISKGPANESGQVLTFQLTPTDATLFAAGPAIDPATGNLTFTPATDAFGITNVDIKLTDNGGTANGGLNSSATETISIELQSVNDEPTFVLGGDLVAVLDAPAQTVSGHASAISKGPANESSQVLTFMVTNNNNGIFSVQPDIDETSGDLTYTPANGQTGIATVSVTLMDDGGTDRGGDNTSPTLTFDITITEAPFMDTGLVSKPEGTEDTELEITFATILSETGANDPDGTIDAFQVTSITSGTLKIGTSSGTATAYAAGTNELITSSLSAYWTPATDEFGDPLDAFNILAVDNDGLTSDQGATANPPQAVQPKILAVNDPPSFTKGANQLVGDTYGAQTIAGWATNISAGPANESDQIPGLVFEFPNITNSVIFDALPQVDPSTGDLTFTPKVGQFGVSTVDIRLKDGGGEYSTTQQFTIEVKAAPTLTTIAGTVRTTNEDTRSNNIRSDNHIFPASDASDPDDGTFTSNADNPKFRVTSVISGTLEIGGNPFAAGTNDIIQEVPSQLRARWTPDQDVNGASISAFNVVVIDLDGLESQTPVTVNIEVTSVNDPPDITTITSPLKSTAPSTEVEITFAEIAAAADEADVDGTVDAFKVQSIPQGTLNIGANSGSATPFNATTNNTIDATNNAYWTPPAGTGNRNAMQIRAKDDQGATSSSIVTVVISVGANAAPTATGSTVTTNEDTEVTIAFTDLGYADGDGDPMAHIEIELPLPSVGTMYVDDTPQNGSYDAGEEVADGEIITKATIDANLLKFIPVADGNGAGYDSFNFFVNDGTENSAPPAAIITFDVTAVNDVPSFTKGADQTVDEDAGAQTVNTWATAISAGPANESSQTVSFTVNNDNNALFSAQPAVDASGDLTYTPAADANESATVTVSISDDGGTANGGADTSADQTFTITINSVNDVPSFTKGADETINEDAGAQTVTGWATALNKGATNESGQTLSFNVSNDDNTLFSAQPTINASGDLSYTPAADANGSATVTVSISDDGGTANGGVDTSADQTFTITINSVNDVPSFTKGADETINEDAGAQTVNSWATAISAGPANESSQTVSFTVNNDNNALFSAQPAVDATGNLTYTPAADANGSATVTISISDNGGTANGGVDTSADQTFTITVDAVNDVPSFTKGADQTVDEDAGAQTVNSWATAISAGPANESSQTVSFTVNNDNNVLFSAQPAVDPSGNLTYTPAADANGSATVTISISDNGGTANGGVDTSADQTFTITVDAVNDDPTITTITNQNTNEDTDITGISFTVDEGGGADEDSQALTVTATSSNQTIVTDANITVNYTDNTTASADALSPTIDITPEANQTGTVTITVTVQDNGTGALSVVETFDLTVDAINNDPTITAIANQNTNEDTDITGISFTVDEGGGADEDAQALTVTATSSNQSIVADANIIVNYTDNTTASADALSPTIDITPESNQTGTVTITVTVQDDGTGTPSVVETFDLTVDAVNDVPSFTKGADQTVDEDAGAQTVNTWATAISAGPANESSQTVSFTVNNDNNALFSAQPAVDASGNLIYTPAADANGSATVTISISDNGGTTNGGVDTSADQTFTITVDAVNDVPSFTKGADQTVDEDAGAQTVNIWATAISEGPANESSQTVSFTVNNDNNALFSAQPAVDASGNLTYTPAAGANGSATVTISISDNGGTTNGGVDTSADQTFTITVNSVNDVPSFTKGADQTVDEDAGAQTVNSWATAISAGPANESSQTVSFTVNNDNNALFSAQPAVDASGNLTYTPAADANGSATVTISISDNGGTANGGVDTSADQTFTITINSVNDVPSFTKGADQTVDEDAGAQTVNTWATAISEGPANESSQTVSFTVNNDNNALFSAQPAVDATGNLTYTPAADANGSATVTISISDNGGTANGGVDTSGDQTFTITVNSVNDVPSFTKGADQTVDEDAVAQTVNTWATSISAGPANESSQTVSFTVNNDNNALFSAQPAVDATGNLTYTPAADANGSATVTISISDNGGTANGGVDTSGDQTFTITVDAINDQPVITAQAALSTDEETDLTITLADLTVTDPDNTYPVDFTLTVNPGTNYTVSGTTITPATDFNGTLTVAVTVNDGTVDSDPFNLPVSVDPINDQPVITAQATLNTDEETDLTITLADLTVTDPDNTYPADFTLTVNTGTNYTVSGNTITPATDFNGTLTVPVTVNDGTVDSDPFNLSVSVDPINDQPVITAQATLSTDEETDLTITLADLTVTDPDNTYPVDFTLTVNTGTNYTVSGTTITPATDFNGTLTVAVTVNDGTVDSDPFNLSVSVDPINDQPVITAQATLNTDEETDLTITLADLTVTDPDNTYPADFTLTVNTGTNYTVSGNTITPATDFNGTLTVPVTVNDGTVDSDPFNLSITVDPINDQPVITAQATLSADEETDLTITLADLTVTDPDNTYPADFTLTVNTGTNYTVSGNTITPATDFNGTLTVPVTVNDGTVDSDPLNLSVTVNAVNDAPSFTKGNDITIDEDAGVQSVSGWATSISWGASDENSQTLTFVISTDNDALFQQLPKITASGELTFLTAENAFGTAEVTVTLKDDGGTSNGGEDTSDPQTFMIDVNPINDAPVITSHMTKSVTAGVAFTVELDELTVQDPDNTYPNDFTLTIIEKSEYTVNSNEVTVIQPYSGTLDILLKVTDGLAESNDYSFTVDVDPGNNLPPEIQGQQTISIEEDTDYEIIVADLNTTDPDDGPDALSIVIFDGDNYTYNGATITPSENFNGTLFVNLSVFDGEDQSNLFAFTLSVDPVNDFPEAISDEYEVALGIELSGNVLENDVDIDADALSTTSIDNSSNQAIFQIDETGTFTFESIDQLGQYFQFYTLCDSGTPSLCVEGMITVTVVSGDFDGDGIPDEVELSARDTDEDGVMDYRDDDSDGDGIPDNQESGPNPNEPVDTDGDGTPDYRDTDSDGDTIDDEKEGVGDCDGDGIPNFQDDNELCERIVAVEGFSPNGDGINDFWIVEGLEEYPKNIVEIYNRWGSKVTEIRNYDNDQNVWNGENEKGKQVPDGTYFYIVRVTDQGAGPVGSGNQINGYIVIAR